MRSATELKELLGNDPPLLLDRNTAGLKVNISYISEEDILLLECETGGGYQIAEIPHDKVMDAFNHPCLYVANPSELFPKSKSL